MEQIIFGISDRLQEKVTKKQFLKECGFLLLGAVVFPSLLTNVLLKPRLRIEGNNFLIDDEIIIERK